MWSTTISPLHVSCTLILLVQGLCTKPPTPQDNLNLEPITYPLKNKTNPKA
jgi:hypothetical protein